MQDISKLAAKRIGSLQQISRYLDSRKIQMEEELDKASKDIDETEDSMHSLIKQHAATLKAKVEKAREVARKYFADTQRKNSRRPKEMLPTWTDHVRCSRPVHIPGVKQQFLQQQQQVSVPSIQCNIYTEDCKP